MRTFIIEQDVICGLKIFVVNAESKEEIERMLTLTDIKGLKEDDYELEVRIKEIDIRKGGLIYECD